VRIIAYSTQYDKGRVLISESTEETCLSSKLDELFGFLLEPYENTLRVCWNLDETVSPILRLLGRANCEALYKTHRLRIPPFNIFYISGKVFSLEYKPTRNVMSLYGIDQYYPDLENHRSVEEIEYLGLTLMAELAKMNLYPTKLTSPIAIYEQCVLNHLNLPVAADMPAEAVSYCLECSAKLWIEAYAVGFYDRAFDYDISSAFPLVATELIDYRHCDWVKSAEYQPKAIYGYIRCRVTINDDVKVSPIIYIDEQGGSSTPVGSWDTYLTKGELDFIDKWKIGSYQIYDGWWAIPRKIVKPLKIVMERLLAYKEKTNLQAMLAKRMSVSVVGKLIEEREDAFGPHFNPAWHAEVTSTVRLWVAEFVYEHKMEDHLIAVGVDGVLLDDMVELNIGGKG